MVKDFVHSLRLFQLCIFPEPSLTGCYIGTRSDKKITHQVGHIDAQAHTRFCVYNLNGTVLWKLSQSPFLVAPLKVAGIEDHGAEVHRT